MRVTIRKIWRCIKQQSCFTAKWCHCRGLLVIIRLKQMAAITVDNAGDG
jgi:hypothetical protein